VVKDFHARSLHEPIEPMIMQYNPYYGLILKTNTADLKSLLSSMQQKWEAFGTGEAFEYAFMDQLFNETYVKEANMNTVLRYFALLTIFIACLGLYGLITFTTERRFKEIGIRKSLGSTVPQIVALLSKDFLKLIGISLLVAFPVGYYVMSIWLQDFEYRINMQWWYFAIAGVSTVVIALFTISFRSIKAANMDPVESLRAE
jgi:putative ABC transport system permease protein